MNEYYYGVRKQKRYTIWSFIFDILMTGITGGLWLFWLLLKFLRTNSR